MQNTQTYFAGIETGGTKIVCAIGQADGNIIDSHVVPTTTPDESMPLIIEYFSNIQKTYPFVAMGVGSFGPIDANPSSPNFGEITTTPKLAWRHFNIINVLKEHFKVPTYFDTDVNVAAYGEYLWGAGQGLDNFVYLTIGTGIGGSAFLHGQSVHGLTHSEMGHMRVPRNQETDPFKGVCPYHGDCLEGLACGEAVKKRWQVKSALDLPPDHPAWELEAEYLAQGITNLIWAISPQRFILGGGVMAQTQLFAMIQQRVHQLIGGYLEYPELEADYHDYIVPPGLVNRAGASGAIALAKFMHDRDT